MATNKLANLKSQLLTSGLAQKDQPLFQIINQLIGYLQDLGIELNTVASSSGSSGITSLSGDVVAAGPGAAVATIQPQAVTYVKMQDTVFANILLGRGSPAGTLTEILLGANLQIVGDTLEITTSGGGSGGGLAHNLLSATHPDTIAAEPVLGDLIYAGPGSAFVGTYVNAVIMNTLVDDIPMGIYGAFYIGFEGNGMIAPVSGAISIMTKPLIVPPLTEAWLTWDILDFVILMNLIFDATDGLYGYLPALVPGGSEPGQGVYGALSPPAMALIAPPSPLPDYSSGLWRRKAVGVNGQVLTVVSGSPEWEDLPPIPAEPEYPWTDITFAAGDFTASGGATPTWTVAAGNVKRWQKQQFPGVGGVGNNVRIALYVRDTTVGGTAPTQLRVTLPFNILGRFAEFISIQEAGAASNDVFVEYDDSASTNTLFIQKIGGAVFDTTAGGTFLAFEISAVLAP